MYDEVPSELRQQLPHDIRLYMRNFWQHPNEPTRNYDFYTDGGPPSSCQDGEEPGEFLHYLAHDDGPLVPSNWGQIVLLNFARGCLKTTTATAVADWGIGQYPMIEVDVTAPRQEQFREVMDRFKGAVKNSGLEQLRSKNNISHQKFERRLEKDNGETVAVEADVKARSAWGEGDALRGLHGHVGIVDEFQDVDESMFSTFLEAVDQSVPQVDYFPVIFIIGTPKMANSFFHTLWKMSDQKTWDDEQKEWVQQAEADEFLPTGASERRDDLRDEIAELESLRGNDEVDQEALEAEIQSKQQAVDAISGYEVTGWHIDQYASPMHDNSKIEFKRQNYSEKKFKNEVLAQFYTPENDLLSDSHVTEALDDTRGFRRSRQYDDSIVTMGVDWGGGDSEQASDTVIVVGEQRAEDNTITILDLEFVDGDASKQEELEAVEARIRDYQVDRVAVDEGYGAKQREDLQDGNNIWKAAGWDQVCGVIYGNIKEKDKPKFADSNFTDSAYCTVARTHMIENFVDDFKSGAITIPADDLADGRGGDQTRLIDQLTAPYTDRTETSDGKKKLKVMADRNDDACHAFTYMWLAANRFGSQRTLRKVGAHSRAGY